jgi:hypothetical protein
LLTLDFIELRKLNLARYVARTEDKEEMFNILVGKSHEIIRMMSPVWYEHCAIGRRSKAVLFIYVIKITIMVAV